MKYRAEIDGLRALAVVPVILFHAGIELFSGGVVGVDIFFVISGYLITTILIEDLENKRFSIVNFYERRARRILPALFLVVFVCIPFAWIWMLPSQMESFSGAVFSLSVFLSNLYFMIQVDYFAPSAELNPLLHTWSLSVEEQFYLFFPPLLFLFFKRSRRFAFAVIFIMLAVSFVYSEWAWRENSERSFFFSFNRFWELFAGSIAAFIVQKRGVQKSNFLALLGLAAIVFSIFAYDQTTPFPSVYALVPVLGVVLLVLFADQETIVAKLLSTKGFVGIGLISYSAYLWHQPLFAFARIRSLKEPSEALMLMLGISSIVLAYFSWKYVEKPFRKGGLFSRKSVFRFSIVGIFSFATFGFCGLLFSKPLENYWLSSKTAEYKNVYVMLASANTATSNWKATGDGKQVVSDCVFNVREFSAELGKRLLACKERHGSGALVLGDSHAIDLFGVVASSQNTDFLIGVTRGGCRPHTNHSYCHYDAAQAFLAENPGVFDLVIYEQAGFYLLQERDGTKGSRKMFHQSKPIDLVEDIVADKEHIKLTANYLSELSKFVSVKWFLPRAEPHIDKKNILENGCNHNFEFRENQREAFENLDAYIESYIAENYANVITTVNQNKFFAFNFPTDFMNCKEIYWSDSDHLSTRGEEYFGTRLPKDILTPSTLSP